MARVSSKWKLELEVFLRIFLNSVPLASVTNMLQLPSPFFRLRKSIRFYFKQRPFVSFSAFSIIVPKQLSQTQKGSHHHFPLIFGFLSQHLIKCLAKFSLFGVFTYYNIYCIKLIHAYVNTYFSPVKLKNYVIYTAS